MVATATIVTLTQTLAYKHVLYPLKRHSESSKACYPVVILNSL